MHTMLLIFHLVSLLGVGNYLYLHEQYENFCFLFKVSKSEDIHNNTFLSFSDKSRNKTMFTYFNLFIKVIFGIFVSVHVPL